MPNRLASEKSPYLRQHAENPVEWYPWGPEAFERARQEDKPLLISIGYSTCHWCHVMERESFENPAIAAVMNRHLVCVKVDREERPDVDRIYMTAVQAQTGQGGWPLNVFVTPAGEPFIGGTYFPPEDRYGRRGWPAVVEAIGIAWRDPPQRARLTDQGKNLARLLYEFLTPQKVSEPAMDPVTGAENCFRALDQSFDPAGGFSPAPKFPMPVNQYFLFRYAACTGGDKGHRALSMALETLRAMARGGIFDHVGGGFHRYSTDGEWFLPHFEKMLYDNAQLALNYIEAYQLSTDLEFARTATLTLDYILRDLLHPAGGFYSAEDADSLPPGSRPEDGAKEGAFYLWGEGELRELLGNEDAAMVGLRYGVKPDGNVAADPHGEFAGGNHLHEALPLPEVARAMDRPVGEVAARLERARQRLLERRSQRPRPFRDEKILTAWNGLALSALARGSAVLGEERFLNAAQEAASFLKKNLWDGGRLYRRWGDGARAVPGMVSDHVFLAQGLADLYEADFNPAHLLWAEQLLDETLQRFQDPVSGALFTTAAGHDPLVLVRAKEEGDQVEPSSASVAAGLLFRLARLRSREDFRLAAERMAAAHLGGGHDGARAFPHLRATLLLNQRPGSEVVIAGLLSDPGTQALLRVVRNEFLPHMIVLLVEGGAAQETLSQRLPFLKGMRPVEGKPTAYFCHAFACRTPTVEPRVLQESVDSIFNSI